jgi:hypothetical protein
MLGDFDRVWIDFLNGDSRETGKKTPTGEPDPSAFSTKYNTAGIRLGTTIGLFTRKLLHQPAGGVAYRDFWGKSKRSDLRASIAAKDFDASYTIATPNEGNRFSFRPHEVSAAFQSWPKVIELCDIAPTPGLQEMRYGSLMSLDKTALEQQMSFYFDATKSWPEIAVSRSGPARDAGRFDAEDSRETLLKRDKFDPANVRRYSLYPLDNRWAYWSSVRPLWNEPRPALAAQAFPTNRFFITRRSAERPSEGVPVTCSAALPDYHLLRPNVVAIPFMVEHHGEGLFAAERKANLSKAARAYMKAIGVADPDSTPELAYLIWLHALAICFSPEYLNEHRDGVLGDWPRIPLPSQRSALEASAVLGDKLASLLDPDSPVPGVTQGVSPQLLALGGLSRVDGKPLKPVDLVLSAGWGHRTSTGIVMPGSGRIIKRAYSSDELSAIGDGAEILGPPFDIMLNDVAMWRSVPANVWEYRIGGYQVLKKWLSYRDEGVLGRPLTKDEAREVTAMVHRIAATILMAEELNANYTSARDGAFLWPSLMTSP